MTAFLLMAAWLPATMHCGLEAAVGAEGASDCAGAAACCAGECGHDNCNLLESGMVTRSLGTVKIPMPAAVCACLICFEPGSSVVSGEPVLADDGGGRLPDWIPDWQFVRRAAPPSRAPSDFC